MLIVFGMKNFITSRPGGLKQSSYFEKKCCRIFLVRTVSLSFHSELGIALI